MLLLENIKERCHCDRNVEVELSDTQGNIKFLAESPTRYANEVLQERETCVLLRVEKSGESGEEQKAEYFPLLNDDDAITESFLARLSTKEKLSINSGKGSKKKNKKDDRGRDANRHPRSGGAKSTTPTGRRTSKQR
ncbi:hypothetical protein HOLleu_22424 [Holothuria leucospilota]|uniref:Uncharacterized protein n=1 Tax=Holothuria leucospilota TaxID=206669 RepID=A0A9Q1BZ76_HOLLE|nr:hypothetical protein HOLleu_22424 [Holothuria leucospilota]